MPEAGEDVLQEILISNAGLTEAEQLQGLIDSMQSIPSRSDLSEPLLATVIRGLELHFSRAAFGPAEQAVLRYQLLSIKHKGEQLLAEEEAGSPQSTFAACAFLMFAHTTGQELEARAHDMRSLSAPPIKTGGDARLNAPTDAEQRNTDDYFRAVMVIRSSLAKPARFFLASSVSTDHKLEPAAVQRALEDLSRIGYLARRFRAVQRGGDLHFHYSSALEDWTPLACGPVECVYCAVFFSPTFSEIEVSYSHSGTS